MFWTQPLNKESRFALSQGELGGCGKGAVKEQEPEQNKGLASCSHLMQKHIEMYLNKVCAVNLA